MRVFVKYLYSEAASYTEEIVEVNIAREDIGDLVLGDHFGRLFRLDPEEQSSWMNVSEILNDLLTKGYADLRQYNTELIEES